MEITNNKSVMLIDDDAITNIINTKIITMKYAYEVKDFSSAQKALEQLKEWGNSFPEKLPFVIFLDINMPVMDGWEFLEEFQKLPKIVQEKSKVYMLTSSIAAEDIEKAKAYHVVNDFVSKPLSHEKLATLFMN
jgi:CheY-like chemotaxis protein